MKSAMLHERRRIGEIIGLDGISRGCSGRELYAPDAAVPSCGPSLVAPQLCPLGGSYFYDNFESSPFSMGYWIYNPAEIVVSGGQLQSVDSAVHAGFFARLRSGLNGAVGLAMVGVGDFTMVANVTYRTDAGAASLIHAATMGLSNTDAVPSFSIRKNNLNTIGFDYFNNGAVTDTEAYVAGTTRTFQIKYQRVAGVLSAYRDGVLKGSMGFAGDSQVTLSVESYLTGATVNIKGTFLDFWLHRASTGLPGGLCAGT